MSKLNDKNVKDLKKELKKDFNNYLLKFKTSDKETHWNFNNKVKYNIPDKNYDEFYKMYYDALVKNEKLYIVEKINNVNKFAFFLDIEVPKKNDNLKIKSGDVKIIIEKCKKSIDKMFDGTLNQNLNEHIITRRNDKYHVNYPNLIINTVIAQSLVKMIIDGQELNTDQKKYIDISVYRSGLRLFGSKKSDIEIKKEKENFEEDISSYSSIYEIYDIDNNELESIEDLEFKDFMKLVIRQPNSIELTKIFKEYENKIVLANTILSVKGNVSESVKNELIKLFSYLKMTNNEYLESYTMDITKITITQNRSGIYCYYVTINDHLCPFYGRNHRRESTSIYIELSIAGVFIKCHDQDCLKRKYPDEGFKLPDNFELEYPELYLSMTTKYWKTEVDITPSIKKLLEESLTGSHYKIAKVIYNIYKDSFRIDDIRNPDWYEFDGIKWTKTHIMNILISEELQKYYNGIKISDTGALKNNDLEEFLETSEKVESNMRNSMVENIINKLENVTFKKSVMTEMHYLFKSLEPNFISKLDSNPYLLGFKNGIYDLETFTFRNGNPKDYVTLSTGYEYIDYDSELDEVKDIYSFLKEIIPNDKVREYLLKILGRSLCGINDEKFYILTGLSGANGKSTLINFLEYTLNDYATGADVSLLTNAKALSSAASPDVIRLKGKRLVSFAEPEARDTLKAGIIKSFSGGDSIIARELYKAPISFKLQASMFLCTNDIPNISSFDGGVSRRLRVINFTSRFCDNPIKENEFKIDPTIKTKIKNWRPYFMSILLHYYSKYEDELCENGSIEEPEEVKIATNKYKKDNDRFNDYINENIKEEPNAFETLRLIYHNFNIWWVANYSNNKTPDIKELRKSLRERYGEEIVQIVNNITQTGFNIKLIQNDLNMIDEE